MITATTLSLTLSAFLLAAQNQPAPVFACNLKAISADERPRYNELVKRVRAAIRNRRELPDGYELQLDSDRFTLAEAGEWMGMERLCCPFLTLELSSSGSLPDWTLRLTGSKGVKQILMAEFPGR